MSIRVFLLAVLVLGFCLVSLVSAGCGGCITCGAKPRGGWGPPDYSNNPYWGMSADEINIASAANRETTIGPDYWLPPKIVIPSPNTSKFAGLQDYASRSGGAQSLFSKDVSLLKPDTDGNSNLMTKQLFF